MLHRGISGDHISGYVLFTFAAVLKHRLNDREQGLFFDCLLKALFAAWLHLLDDAVDDIRAVPDLAVAGRGLGKDLSGLLDDDEEQIQYNSLSFTAQDLTSNELYAVASELENGKVTTYQSSVSYYLIRMVNNDSHVAYEEEIQTEIQAAENEKFVEAYTELAENTKISVSRYFDKLEIGKITADDTTNE